MFVNKIGYEHHVERRNCQDFGFINERIKCVVDGCSEGKHSEVGAKLFCQLFKTNENVEETFGQLLPLFSDFESIKHHLLFTILYVEETESDFLVHHAGDGYIIQQHHDNTFSFVCIQQENVPAYYAYNFIPSSHLKRFKEGVSFETLVFSKEQYKKIGVATDGISYILQSAYREEFERWLREGKENRMKMMINRVNNPVYAEQNAQVHGIFKDDITISF